MAKIRTLGLLLALFALGFFPVQAQESETGSLVILPFHSMGVEAAAVQSAESILRQEMGRLSVWDLVSVRRMATALDSAFEFDPHYASAAGQKLGADKVVLCQLSSLGSKIIVQYMLYDRVDSRLVTQDRLTSASVEDLDTVMKRMALTLVEQVPFQETAQVGLITEQESRGSLRRGANKFAGFSFGYLFPLSGYDEVDRSFAMDFRMGNEFENFSVGMQLYLRKGFGVNIFSSYLLSKKDVCPYIGGGLGFHWVSHQTHYVDDTQWNGDGSQDEKKGDGFEMVLNMGLRLFHTYKVQILLNGAFSFTFNDYEDTGFTFTIGLIH